MAEVPDEVMRQLQETGAALVTLNEEITQAEQAAEALEVQRSESTNIVRQLREERARRLATAADELYELAEAGSLEGSALLAAADKVTSHSSKWQRQAFEEAVEFGTNATAGNLVCSFDQNGVPTIHRIFDSIEAKPSKPILLPRRTEHTRQTGEIKVGYLVDFDESGQPVQRTVDPALCVVGKEEIVARLNEEMAKRLDFDSPSSVERAGHIINVLRFLGETEQAEQYLGYTTRYALRQFKEYMSSSSYIPERGALARYLYEHAPDEFQRIYDEKATEAAKMSVMWRVEENLIFLQTYLLATNPEYSTYVRGYAQDDMLLDALRNFILHGRQLLSEQQPVAEQV